jgi:hypothetical protein
LFDVKVRGKIPIATVFLFSANLRAVSADRLNATLEHSISDEELRQAFEGVDAGNSFSLSVAATQARFLEAEENAWPDEFEGAGTTDI